MPRTPNEVTNVRFSADLTTFVRITLIIATLGLDFWKVSYWCWKMSNCSSELYRRHHSELLLCNFDWMRNLLRITLLSRFVHVNWLNWEIWQAVIDKEKNTSNEKNYKICYLAEIILFNRYWTLRESYHPIFEFL